MYVSRLRPYSGLCSLHRQAVCMAPAACLNAGLLLVLPFPWHFLQPSLLELLGGLQLWQPLQNGERSLPCWGVPLFALEERNSRILISQLNYFTQQSGFMLYLSTHTNNKKFSNDICVCLELLLSVGLFGF